MGERIISWEDYRQPFAAYVAAWHDLRGDYQYPLHGHRGQVELVYVSQGSLVHRLNGRRLSQEPGQLLLVREGDRHGLRGTGIAYFNLALPLGALAHYRALAGEPAGGDLEALLAGGGDPALVAVPAVERPDLERRLHGLVARYDPWACVAALAVCLPWFLPERDRTGAGAANGEGWPDWLRAAVARLRANPEPVDLDMLVTWCGRSPEHVARSFRRCTGQSPSAFLAGERLERAVRLIEASSLPVGEVCTRAGFASPNYFHRLFRARFGRSPLEHRRLSARPH